LTRIVIKEGEEVKQLIDEKHCQNGVGPEDDFEFIIYLHGREV
jgi:hypothetical protein